MDISFDATVSGAMVEISRYFLDRIKAMVYLYLVTAALCYTVVLGSKS